MSSIDDNSYIKIIYSSIFKTTYSDVAISKHLTDKITSLANLFKEFNYDIFELLEIYNHSIIKIYDFDMLKFEKTRC